MHSRCNSLLFAAILALACVPAALAQGPNPNEFDGADMPPPPPRGQAREMQPGNWRPKDSLENPEGGFVKGGGRQQRPGQAMRGQGGAHMGGGIGPLDLRPLNLTEEQKQKIQSTRQTTAENMRQVRMNLRMQRTELKDMMFDPKATDLQIRQKRQEVRNLQDKMDELLVNDFLKMRAVLTKEQLGHLTEVKPQARGRNRFGAGDGIERPGFQTGLQKRIPRQRQGFQGQGGQPDEGFRPRFRPGGNNRPDGPGEEI